MVQFHPLNHPTWLALAEEFQPMISPYMLLLIMRGTPFLVHAVSGVDLACEAGFAVFINDTVVAASQEMDSVNLPSQLGPMRASKDKDGDLFVLESSNPQQHPMLKRIKSVDAAILKALL